MGLLGLLTGGLLTGNPLQDLTSGTPLDGLLSGSDPLGLPGLDVASLLPGLDLPSSLLALPNALGYALDPAFLLSSLVLLGL